MYVRARVYVRRACMYGARACSRHAPFNGSLFDIVVVDACTSAQAEGNGLHPGAPSLVLFLFYLSPVLDDGFTLWQFHGNEENIRPLIWYLSFARTSLEAGF